MGGLTEAAWDILDSGQLSLKVLKDYLLRESDRMDP